MSTTSSTTGNDSKMLRYVAKSGETFEFDTSREACEKWGFFSGSRVETPKGKATVIGVHDNYLWFHIDGDRGASFWEHYHNYEDLLRLGIFNDEMPVAQPSGEVTQKGFYRIKRTEYKGRTVSLIQQNENGPCPLIAITNILALRGNIVLDGKSDRIGVDTVVQKIGDFIKRTNVDKENVQLNEVIKTLPDLQFGLDVNFNFLRCDSFESSTKGKVFDLLNIKMLHGWLVDPDSPAAAVIGSFTYDEITLQLLTLNDKQDKDSKERKLTPDEGIIVQDFLASTSHQLTEYGLQKLHECVKEDEFVVFFRNNHFSTLTKHNGQLFNLVTDIGYERERLVVWDLLATVDGNSCFCNSAFQSTTEVKRDEVINTALLYGFPKAKIEEAIVFVSKPNEELKTEDVLSWLNKHCPL